MAKVRNLIELEMFLQASTKGKFEPADTSTLDGHVHGTYEGEDIYISYNPNKGLAISCLSGSREIIDKLVDTLSEAIGGVKPTVGYDIKEEEELIPTMEFHLTDPEARLKEIANGFGTTIEGDVLVNVELLNGKKLEDYKYTDEELKAKLKTVRIYGLEPGNLVVEKVENAPEYEIFALINTFGDKVLQMTPLVMMGFLSEEELIIHQYALEYLVYHTTKFGVEFPEPEYGKHIEKTESYDAWYNFWKAHFDEFTEEQKATLWKLRSEGKDVSEFMPSTSWKESYNREMKPGENSDNE